MIVDLLPPKVRKVVYSLLGSISALVAIPALVPGPVGEKVLAVFSALGFTLAAGNTPKARS